MSLVSVAFIVESIIVHHVSEKKTGPFVILSYLCFDSYELYENFIGGVACTKCGINVCDSLTILC